MKTLGRILIILAAFAIVMGITYVVVNAGSSSGSANVSAFERRGETGSRPDSGQRPDFRGSHGGGWMFGMIRNAGIIAVITALIGVPKSIKRKRMRSASASA